MPPALRVVVDSAPGTAGRKAVRIVQIREGGNKIEKKAIVPRQAKYAAVYGRIADKFRNNVRLLEHEINEQQINGLCFMAVKFSSAIFFLK